MTDEHCVCGRRKLHDSRHLTYSPQRAEVMQRLVTIRESRMIVVCTPPMDHAALASLASEERELRARLARLTHDH